MIPKLGPACVLTQLSPPPGSETRPLAYMVRPPGVAVIDVLCKREQDAEGQDNCPPGDLQWTRFVALEYIY